MVYQKPKPRSDEYRYTDQQMQQMFVTWGADSVWCDNVVQRRWVILTVRAHVQGVTGFISLKVTEDWQWNKVFHIKAPD